MAYLDDIIIPSKTVDEGIDKLRLVLNSLRTANLTLKLEKRFFLSEKIEYLGFEITAEKIAPEQRKLCAVKEFPVPKDISDVRSLLGLTGYFRRFVRGYSIIAKSLTDLIGKNVKFVWGKDEERAFLDLKKRLTNHPILKVYNPEA